MDTLEHAAAPGARIRRFDIFAEWNRLKGREKLHMPERQAREFGLAVAKVVAARKFAGYHPRQVGEWRRKARQDEHPGDDPWWEHVAKPEEFDRKVIERMGRAFYEQVFQPAIRQAWDSGETYEQVRDRLREGWNGGGSRQ